MIEIRCSALPRLAICAPSIAPPLQQIELSHEASRLGTAFHFVMANRIKGETVDVVDAATQFSVNEEELGYLVGWGWSAWLNTISQWFPNPLVEQELVFEDTDIGVRLTGHSDLMACMDATVRVIDWKSGWADHDPLEQLKGYAKLGLERFPEAADVWIAPLRVRDMILGEPMRMTRGQVNAWWSQFSHHLKNDRTYRPGPQQCAFCPRAMECPERVENIRQLVNATTDLALTAPDFSTLLAERSEVIARVVREGRELKGIIERMLDTVKADILIRGDNEYLYVKKTDCREIVASRCWDTLVKTVGLPKLLEIASVGKGDFEDALKGTLPKDSKGHMARGGGKVIKAFFEELDAQGSLKHYFREELKLRSVIDVSGTTPAIGTADANESI